MRKQVSLLIEHGHLYAAQYPLGKVWDEVAIVVERTNQQEASRTALMHAAAAGVMSKKGLQALQKLLKELTA